MSDFKKISEALRENPELREGAKAAIRILGAGLSGKTSNIKAKYISWAELDEAFEKVKIEQLKSTHLRRLFRIAVSAAARAISKGGVK